MLRSFETLLMEKNTCIRIVMSKKMLLSDNSEIFPFDTFVKTNIIF